MKPISPEKESQIIVTTLCCMFFAALSILAILFLTLHPVRVSGSSMEPSFRNLDIVATDVSFDKADLSVGKVIVFTENKNTLIKRLVAMPGDVVEFIDGSLYVNGVKEEAAFPLCDNAPTGSVILGASEYYVLGDNRNHSSDSREFGPIQFDQINGIVREKKK